MTNEQILERQVEALEKLLQLKEAVIGELENKVEKLQAQQQITIGSGSGYVPSVPTVWTAPQQTWQCTDGQPHQYPQHWMSINPPCCTKCGQYPQSDLGGWTITGHQGAAALPAQPLPVYTSGYIQNIPQDNANAVGTVLTLANSKNK